MLRLPPLRTVRASCKAHGSSKPLTSQYQQLADLCRPKDALSQIANKPVGLPPVDGGPLSSSLGSVCRAWGSHPTFPSIGNLYRGLWVVHPVSVSRFSARVWPYPPGYGFPVSFDVAAFASETVPSPLKSSAALAVGLLSQHLPQTSLGLPRSAPMRSKWGGHPLYAGRWCPHAGIQQSLRHMCRYRRLCYPSFRRPALTTLTRIHLRLPVHSFPCLVVLMDRRFLRLQPPLRRSPLPATHGRIGNRFWTLTWVCWFNHSLGATSCRT